MGRSEYGFLIKNDDDYNKVLELMKKHNDASFEVSGEDLEFNSIIRHDDNLYMCLGNGGGRSYTSSFIENHHKGVVYHPFEKPDWWMECEDYVWMNKEGSNIPSNIFNH